MKKIITLICLIVCLIFISCDNDYESNSTGLIWKGERTSEPENPISGWFYYDSNKGCTFLWDGSAWQIIANDGSSFYWFGSSEVEPADPEKNWAYYNIIDGNSYIFDGSKWSLLAKSGRDGASGILLWLGSLSNRPTNPSTGWAYYDVNRKASYIWNGSNWDVFSKDGSDGKSIIWKGAFYSSPVYPQEGWAYFNITDHKSYIWNGVSWDILTESLGGDTVVKVSISWKGELNVAPANPQVGWAYYNIMTKKSYIWDGSAWSIISQDGTSPDGFLITWKGSLITAPINPEKGWAYYDKNAGQSLIWDGNSWEIIAQDGLDGTGAPSVEYGPKIYISNILDGLATETKDVFFEDCGVGSIVKKKRILIYNSNYLDQDAVLLLSGSPIISITGPDASCFQVNTEDLSNTLKYSDYTNYFDIIFSPTSIGFKTAEITIINNSVNMPNLSFTVTGKALAWDKKIDGGEGNGYDEPIDSIIDLDNNFYILGYGYELVSNHSSYDWWIKKFNAAGVEDIVNWDKKVDFNSGNDRPVSIVADELNNIYVSSDSRILKYDSNGTLVWSMNSGGKLLYDSAGYLYVFSYMKISKIDCNTQANAPGQWPKDLSSVYDKIYDIAIDSNSDIYIAGYTDNLIDEYSKDDGLIKKYSSSGDLISAGWDKVIDSGHSDDDVITSICIDSNDNVYIGIKAWDLVNGASDWDGSIKKYSSNGNEIPYYSESFEEGGIYDLHLDSNNNLYFNTGSYSNIQKITFSGKKVVNTWPLALDYSNFSCLTIDSLDNIYVGFYGYNLISDKSSRDWWIKKFDENCNEF